MSCHVRGNTFVIFEPALPSNCPILWLHLQHNRRLLEQTDYYEQNMPNPIKKQPFEISPRSSCPRVGGWTMYWRCPSGPAAVPHRSPRRGRWPPAAGGSSGRRSPPRGTWPGPRSRGQPADSRSQISLRNPDALPMGWRLTGREDSGVSSNVTANGNVNASFTAQFFSLCKFLYDLCVLKFLFSNLVG